MECPMPSRLHEEGEHKKKYFLYLLQLSSTVVSSNSENV